MAAAADTSPPRRARRRDVASWFVILGLLSLAFKPPF
jgi:hypothetical protein